MLSLAELLLPEGSLLTAVLYYALNELQVVVPASTDHVHDCIALVIALSCSAV